MGERLGPGPGDDPEKDMTAFLVSLLLTCVATAVPADVGAGAVPQGPEAEALGSEVFMQLYGHVMPHKVGSVHVGGIEIPTYNLQYFQIGAVLLIVLLFGNISKGVGRSDLGPVRRVLAGWVLWIRDEMVVPVMGPERGGRFTPYFCYVFFFVLFMNMLGLLPGGSTATASIFVTAAMALTTMVLVLGFGIWAQGPIAFWKNLVPSGVPLAIWPLMFLVELIGIVVKHVALTIRLFANMLAGHLVVLSFMGLIFYFAQTIDNWAYLVAVPSVGLAVFIMIIEAFVALLQAYVFTLLSIVFIGAAIHPEH